MVEFPEIDPAIVSFGPFEVLGYTLGPLSVHWYGLTYLIGLLGAWWLGTVRSRKPGALLTDEQMSDVIFYGALGVILGGRLGSVLFYNFDQFLEDPLWLFRVWEGGMAFHGGLLGVITAMYLYGRHLKISLFAMTDFIAPLVPIGLGAGRIGNFINGELWGRATDVPWAMVFPGAEDGIARHPSQLYQFALEGVALFIILWWFSSKPRPRMAVSGLFLVCYGLFRFGVEFFRQPDSHIGFAAFDWMTMGQILSLPMILLGVFFMVTGYRKYAVPQ